MSNVVNLRRARKQKDRDARATKADANRAAHGVAKTARKFGKAQQKKERERIEGHRLEEE